MDRYETQLYRYYVLSKQKEASALREDAFQMYEQRKLFVNTTSDHFGKLVSFKANLENLLVECFSGALSCLIEELDESNHSFQIVKERITGWKQWIEESNVTTEYQLNKIKRRCQELQDNFLVEMKPARSLKRYNNDQMTEEPEVVQSDHSKHGYLNSKIMTGKSPRASWMRRWFFLQDGWFGACTVKKSNIQLSDRIPIHEAQARILTELDNRRFCFEVSHPTYTFHLQAETHQELQQWISTIEYNIKNEPPKEQQGQQQQPELLLSPKNTMKSFINTDTPIVAMSTSPLLTAIDSKKNLMNPFISTTTSSLISSMLQNANIPTQDQQQQQQNTLPNSTANSSGILSSWGMPWLSSTGTEEDQQSSSTQDDNQLQDVVIWPTRIQSNVTIPTLTHYSNKLKQSQKDLRTLFLHVPDDEIVIESFLASLYRQPSLDEEEEDGAIDTSASYGYTGITMITQRHIWFYSCNFMTCVNMLVIPLEKINTVRLENTYHSNGSLLLMESDESFCFGLWLESADIISEKLNYIIANKMKPVQEVYNRVRLMTTAKRTPTSRLTTSISLFASVTPLTVQAQPITTAADDNENNEEEDTSVHRGSPAQGALAAVAARNQKHLDQIQKTTPKPSESTTQEDKPDADWPSDIPQPQAPVDCSCTDHLEKTEIDTILSISAYDLFTLLFQAPDMWNQLNQSKNCTAPTFTPWENGKRVMEYVMPVSNPMVKVKEAHVNETQEIQEQKSHVSYVVTVTTRTPTLPYADAFLPTIKYCITYETATTCRLKCSIGVKWLKSIFVKGMVNRAAMKGMQETISGLIPIIEKQVNTNRPSTTATTAPIQQQQQRQERPVVEKGTSWVHLFTFGLGLVCALFTIYQTRLYQKALNQHGTITWRGVYMKDLEQEINPVRYEKNETAVFGLFKKARQDVTQYNYQWASKQHRHMAMELGYSRERLGAIRYELLSTFRILNRVEMQLLENEYWNWIMDKQLNCQKDNLCEALENEIK